jgi:hypothetical protein
MDFTRQQLLDEIDEKSKDLAVFSKARDDIRRRVQEVVDSKSVLTPLPMWSGTDAVLGSLDLAIHAMEGTIRELQQLLEQAAPEPPTLRVIRSDDVPQG